MTVLGGALAVLAMLTGLLHDVTQLATSPSGLTALTLGGAAVLAGALGLRESGGAVRAGLVHYNDQADVDRLLAGVAGLA